MFAPPSVHHFASSQLNNCGPGSHKLSSRRSCSSGYGDGAKSRCCCRGRRRAWHDLCNQLSVGNLWINQSINQSDHGAFTEAATRRSSFLKLILTQRRWWWWLKWHCKLLHCSSCRFLFSFSFFPAFIWWSITSVSQASAQQCNSRLRWFSSKLEKIVLLSFL